MCKINFYNTGMVALLAGLLTGCYTPAGYGPSGGTRSLSELQQISVPSQTGHPHHRPASSGEVNQIRYQAIQDTAMSLGARSGLSWRSGQIDNVLSSDEQDLDETYNFYGLILPHDVLPPVLVEAQNILNLASPDTIRLAQKTFRIIQQAHFITAPPTWRDYIWMNYPQPEMPDNSLLPRNAVEKYYWNHYVSIGWNNGITQANTIFMDNLNRLDRDYNGMVLYLKLYQQNMVSAPFVAQTDLGITGDGTAMSIDDQILRITALPQLNLNGNTWKPILVPENPKQIRLKQKIQRQLTVYYKVSTQYGYIK